MAPKPEDFPRLYAWLRWVALPIGLAALIGSHTIAWTLREAFPINAYLTIVLCCAAAANLEW